MWTKRVKTEVIKTPVVCTGAAFDFAFADHTGKSRILFALTVERLLGGHTGRVPVWLDMSDGKRVNTRCSRDVHVFVHVEVESHGAFAVKQE